MARSRLQREAETCDACGSSVRYRAIVHLLSSELFGQSLALPRFPVRQDIVGVGFSDWGPFAEKLAEKLGYRNTYLHREPVLDLCDVPPDLHRSVDFCICSDVLEHVAPPVETAIEGCLSLLKPGGFLLLTVPYTFDDTTTEHFPSLRDYAVVELAGERALVNRTDTGQFELFSDLVFHGGVGETLEMRLFGLEPLLHALGDAGFVGIEVADQEVPGSGVVWTYPWSLPIVARVR